MKNIMILMAVFAALVFSGCNSNSSTRNTPPPPAPVQPVQPVQPVEPDPGTPDVGTGSVQYTPSCGAGFAQVKYVFQSESSIDPNSFIVVHIVNGQKETIEQGSVNGNGSVSSMTEDVYIRANEGDSDIAHQIQVTFISDGVSQVDTFSFMQPTCTVVEPTEPDKPDLPEPNGPAQPYAPNTYYNVGDVVTVVDAKGVTRTYICNTAYVSGYQGTWTQFKKELGKWTRIANTSVMKVNII